MAHGFLNGPAFWESAFCVLLSILFCSTIGNSLGRRDDEPEFLAPLENHTVIQGRDVSFTCIVHNLQTYKVAWIKEDSRAILAAHTHMIATNPRLSVTHNGHNTWKLHLTDVQPEDSGAYMCQVNTEPMRSQIGHMKVVTPPDIVDEASERLESLERGDVHLRCRASGNPKPEITWRRENGRAIYLRPSDADNAPSAMRASVKSEQLHLIGVLRQDMGFYLCIASNGVPPTVSKRYYVNVLFKPTVTAKNHIALGQTSDDVILECVIESTPKSLVTWYASRNKNSKGVQVTLDDRRVVTESALNDYTYQVSLTIRKLRASDFGWYTCSAENSLGETNATLHLRENREWKMNKQRIKEHNSLSLQVDHQKLNDLNGRGEASEYIDLEFSNFPASPGAHYDSPDFPSAKGAAMKNHGATTFLTLFSIIVYAFCHLKV